MTIDCNLPHLHIAANLSHVKAGADGRSCVEGSGSAANGSQAVTRTITWDMILAFEGRRAVKVETSWTNKFAHTGTNAATRVLTSYVILDAYVVMAFGV